MSVKRIFRLLAAPVAFAMLAAPRLEAAAPSDLAITLVDSRTGATVAPPYRWLVQLDTTFDHTPGPASNDPLPHKNLPTDNGFTPHPGEALSVSFHASYAPVLAAGDSTDAEVKTLNLDPAKRYFVSVMPYFESNFNMSGAPVVFTGGSASATVALSPLPIPTAQISVLVFEDKHPINNEPEVPEERGLPGFTLQLYDVAGQLGSAGGLVSQDAFGHKLGTTYDPVTGDVLQEGTGVIMTDANGEAHIKYLPAGKWSVQAIPPNMPPGQEWHQTSTLEGKKDIEAFTKANEPPVFVEFGPPGYHVFIGFVQQFSNLRPGPNTVTLTGRITNNHTTRPPQYSFYSGAPIKRAWVALNDLAGGAAGEGIYAAPCDPVTGAFSIPNVPKGSSYQIVSWDDNLDDVFAFYDASVPVNAPDGTYDLGDIPVFSWFSRLVVDFFYDTNGNGIRDPGEPGIKDQNLNIRWRSGAIYDSAVTDDTGRVEFKEVFPFFNWLVTEFDFSRWGSTGLTVHVDNGGPINPSDPATMGGNLNPQLQPSITPPLTNNKARFEAVSSIDGSLVATQAFQVFAGQTVHMEYAKHVWGDNTPNGGVMQGMPNGGIAGGVWYDTTRAEDDPRWAVAEQWCPGIPRIQMYLYNEDPRATSDPALGGQPNPAYHGKIADTNGNGRVDLADVDNWPFGWADGSAPMGPEDVKRNGADQAAIDACNVSRACAFDLGDAIQTGGTTSWDDAQPTGCVGPVFYANGIQDAAHATDCFDGLRNFNQARDGSSDGFYGFGGVNGPGNNLPAGNYIVEAVPPPGYKHTSEESKNVNFGPSYTPSPNNLLPECVGPLHDVGTELELFPGVSILPGYTGLRHSCDQKLVTVTDGLNAAADFFLYTLTPVAANLVGVTTDDLTNEFDPNAPNFGEKYAPPNMPVSIQDWTGRELFRTYTDRYGAYNALVPSSYAANIPVPSGYAPNMLVVCMNHPGPVPDPAHPGQTMLDPHYLRQYSQFCYVWSFMPGETSYLDTPVVPVAAFTGAQQTTLDCELPNGTPKVHSATGAGNANGPYVSASGQLLTLVSEGTAVPVMNPRYDTTDPTFAPRTINRDYGFGSCPVLINGVCTNGASVTIAGLPQQIVSWSPDLITLNVTNVAPAIGQLVVKRGDNGKTTVAAVTVTVGGAAPKIVPPGGTIQAVLDDPFTVPGDLVMVPCGRYPELLIMTKPVRLQGQGPGCVTIDATRSPNQKVNDWNNRMQAFMADPANARYVLPGMPTGAGVPEPTLFATEQGPGLIVLGPSGSYNASDPVGRNVFGINGGYTKARVDGFTFTGADQAGAIFINGYAHRLQITNNHIVGNAGNFGGGIRAGYPNLVQTVGGADEYVNAFNDNMLIAYNEITENAGLAGAGGGVSLCTGSTSYQVTKNWICGNFSNGSGGGIGHLGFSDNGVIDHNTVIFNQTFDQSTTPGGGGIFVGGEAAIANAAGNTISPGTGDVTINANLIQGNLAGAGDGGGIRAEYVNGNDVASSGNNSTSGWSRLGIYNNFVANNAAGLAGGGVSLQDVAFPDIVNNTIVDNDSLATAGSAFPAGSPNQSSPFPGGVVSHAHSSSLAAAFASKTNTVRRRWGIFSNPGPLVLPNTQATWFANNIVYGNRSFYAVIDPNAPTTTANFILTPQTGNFAGHPNWSQDLGVIGTGPTDCPASYQVPPSPSVPCYLHPVYSLLTSLSGRWSQYAATVDRNRTQATPGALFLSWYLNGSKSALAPFGTTTDIQMAPAFDEGGNFIDVRFQPLTIDPTSGYPTANYSIRTGTNAGSNSSDASRGGFSFSSLYNTGNPTPWSLWLTTDYFGNARPHSGSGNRPDIGAVEVE